MVAPVSLLLRAGLVGCGRIGAFTRPELIERLGPNWLPLSHAEALAACDGVELVACCDPDEDGLSRAADAFGAVGRYTDHEALLSAERIDLLAIATRADVRPAIIRRAVEGGVSGIHSEKPLALSLGEALGAVEAMKAAGTCFSYGALRRYMPVFQRARALVAEGALGEPRTVTIRFGKGALLWAHPHSVDLMCFLAGDVRVAAVQATLDLDAGVVTGGKVETDPVVLSATILFENGVVGQIVPENGLCADIGGSSAGLSVLGDGAYILHRTYGLARDCDAERRWRFEVDPTQKSGRLLALEDLRDSVLDRRPAARITLDQVAGQHRVLFAMLQSHLEGGRRVALDEVDPALTIAPRKGQPSP